MQRFGVVAALWYIRKLNSGHWQEIVDFRFGSATARHQAELDVCSQPKPDVAKGSLELPNLLILRVLNGVFRWVETTICREITVCGLLAEQTS